MTRQEVEQILLDTLDDEQKMMWIQEVKQDPEGYTNLVDMCMQVCNTKEEMLKLISTVEVTINIVVFREMLLGNDIDSPDVRRKIDNEVKKVIYKTFRSNL